MEGKMLLVTILVMILAPNVDSGAPDHFGRTFIIPEVDFIYVYTFKQYNVSVRSTCHQVLSDFNVSFGAPLTILKESSGATIIEADDDIVVFVVKYFSGYHMATPLFPTDVLTSNYLVITSGLRSSLSILDQNVGSIFNITFRPCHGRCSLPECATRNYSGTIPLRNCSHIGSYSCGADLTGSQITGNSPIMVTVNRHIPRYVKYRYVEYQLPPTSTWGKQFIIPSSLRAATMDLKFMTKYPATTVKLQCAIVNFTRFSTSTKNINKTFFLENQGDFFTESLDISLDCVLISDHPILVLGEYRGLADVIFPTNQFLTDYIFSLQQLCGYYRAVISRLVVIIETSQVTGLRMNGLKMPANYSKHEIENTNFTQIVYRFSNFGNGGEMLVILRHIQPNVSFGAFLKCYGKGIIPLGSRMAPIAEPCVADIGIPGDGLDNDCDGLIDEDICSSNAVGNDCSAVSKDYLPCFGYTDEYGVTWKTTFVNECDHQPRGTGADVSSNFCEPGEGFMGIWKGSDRSLCGNPELSKLTAMISSSNNESLGDILYKVWNLTDRLIQNHTFSAADIKTVVGGLNSSVTLFLSRSNVSTSERDNFVGLLDRILSPENEDSWKILNNKTDVNYASIIMAIVPRFGDAVWKNSPSGGIIYKQNIIIEGRSDISDNVSFPTGSDPCSFSNTATKARLYLSKETIINSLSGSIDYTAIYYQTLSQFMPYINGSYIGSDIVSFSLRDRQNTTDLVPPVKVSFKHYDTDETDTNSKCVFWLFNGSGDGRWSDTGCYAVYRNTSYTECRCNHLTNIAVLLSPEPFSQDDHIAMTIITWPGCVVSIISLVLTLVPNLCLWRNLQSDKTKLLVSLCTVLILAYTVLLAGLNQTNDKIVCTAIAVVLHFLFLCAIFLMAAEGMDVAMTILTAFSQRKSHAVKLIIFSSVTPAIIVLISAVSTNLNGYGTDKYCWLEFSNGLIYAFIVPCSFVVLVNIILAVLVVRKMFTTKAMMKKETKEKIIAGVRSIAVLSPVLGLTWLFGILAFHKDLIVFSYLFAIFNSFQGLLIFIFHGIMNVKIRQGVQRRWNRFKTEHNLDNVRKKAVSKTDSTELKALTGTSSKFTVDSKADYSSSRFQQPLLQGRGLFLLIVFLVWHFYYK